MTVSTHVTSVLNGTIAAVKSLIPLEVSVDKPVLINQPFEQASIGVLIGMTGDIRGRLIIEGTESSVGGIGQAMFGMPLEGEMLESFSGELGNMIAGHLATSLSQEGLIMDITPPTVLIGRTKMYGFDKALSIPIHISDIGILRIILMIEMN